MATRTNGEWQVRFPGFEFSPDRAAYKPCWVRTYPADCDITSPHDHLAVASGAYARWEEWGLWAFWKNANGQWVEDLSGVAFEDVDVAYLDYVLGGQGYVAKRVAAYAKGVWVDEVVREKVIEGKELVTKYTIVPTLVGRWRFEEDSVLKAGQVFDEDQLGVGWMYTNMATFLAYQSRRDEGYDRSKSGFDDPDDTGDTGWASGRTWGAESFDRTIIKRGPWASLLDTYDRLEELKAAILERGPGVVPDDAIEGPYAWVCGQVSRLVEALPATGGKTNRLKKVAWPKHRVGYLETSEPDEAPEALFQALRARADDLLEWAKFLRLEDAYEDEWGEAPLDLVLLGKALRRLSPATPRKPRKKVAVLREAGFRTLSSHGTYPLDYASCYAVG